MATRPNPFESAPQPEMPPVSSGDLRSRLDKVLPKDTKISPDRKWAMDLKDVIPVELLAKATDFIKLAPPEKKIKRAQLLLAVIENKPRGVIGATDQEIALDDCMREVKNIEDREIN